MRHYDKAIDGLLCEYRAARAAKALFDNGAGPDEDGPVIVSRLLAAERAIVAQRHACR
jgi:hypothetical protein